MIVLEFSRRIETLYAESETEKNRLVAYTYELSARHELGESTPCSEYQRQAELIETWLCTDEAQDQNLVAVVDPQKPVITTEFKKFEDHNFSSLASVALNFRVSVPEGSHEYDILMRCKEVQFIIMQKINRLVQTNAGVVQLSPSVEEFIKAIVEIERPIHTDPLRPAQSGRITLMGQERTAPPLYTPPGTRFH